MDFLYSLTEPENALMLLAGLAAFATIVTLAMPLLVSDKLGERMKYVATEREALRRQFREDMARQRTDRLRHDPRGFVKKVVDQLNLHELLEGEEIKGKGESQFEISAVLIYDRALDEVERQQVESYLQTTYLDDSFMFA